MLNVLDTILTMLHLAVIGFNLLGWIWPATRKAHLWLVIATAGSWFVLGAWYGWGYCPLTDWQWQVKRALGETHLPNSFIKYYADKISGTSVDARVVDGITLGAFVLVMLITIYLHIVRPLLHRKIDR